MNPAFGPLPRAGAACPGLLGGRSCAGEGVTANQAKGITMATDHWSLVEPVWLRLNKTWDDPEEFVRRLRSVGLEIGHLYAAHWCQSEVCNGGLHQFFSNSTGLLAPEALEAFRAIGAEDWARYLPRP